VIPENSNKLLSNPKDSRIQRRVPVYSDGEVNHIAIEKVKETIFLKKYMSRSLIPSLECGPISSRIK
jgi:hypothetical protein